MPGGSQKHCQFYRCIRTDFNKVFSHFLTDSIPYFINPFPSEKILDFKFDENCRQFSIWLENTVRKVEIARYEQFLLFSQCLHNTCPCTADTLKPGLFGKELFFQSFIPNNGLQLTKRDIRTFAYIYLSDQPARTAQAYQKLHCPFLCK